MNRISQEQIVVDKVKKNLTQVKSVKGGTVYTWDDYAAFIHHFETLIRESNYSEIYNISSFGANIDGVKNVSFENLPASTHSTLQALTMVQPFKFNIKDFMQEEFCSINNIISILSRSEFSPALVSTIIKSVLVYQYMQAEILEVLQKNFNPELAQEFIEKTKFAIKNIVEQTQRNKLI